MEIQNHTGKDTRWRDKERNDKETNRYRDRKQNGKETNDEVKVDAQTEIQTQK
jgi:hypothetical protein